MTFDPLTGKVVEGAASGIANGLFRAAVKKLTGSNGHGGVCIEQKDPESGHKVELCVTPKSVCATFTDPESGFPVEICMRSKKTIRKHEVLGFVESVLGPKDKAIGSSKKDGKNERSQH